MLSLSKRRFLQLAGLSISNRILPGWLRAIGTVLPQTYGLTAVRALVLTGADTHLVAGSLFGLLVTSVLACAAGYGMLTWALRRAERGGGIGVVV